MIPAPNLDDRRFQDLVDDAKRMVQERCPEWSDHNVSDPGVTLIEAFATMVDSLFYRLNRVPERHYLRFLDLIGLQLFPPAAARTPVTFWLSAARPDTITVPAGSEVAAAQTEAQGSVVFSTVADLPIISCELATVATETSGERIIDRTRDLLEDVGFDCFGGTPTEGDAFYIGLSAALPSCITRLHVECHVEGIGVDPTRPPSLWQAWDGTDWRNCVVEEDSTGAFNRPGDILIQLPAGHAVSVIAGQRAGWLRCLLTEPAADQPAYRASPRIRELTASTAGGTVEAVHAEMVNSETLGASDGSPGQRFVLARAPLVAGSDAEIVQVSTESQGWQAWQQVESFTDSGPNARHFHLDRSSGEISFGPALRRADGTLDQRGAIPPQGALVRIERYHAGGGARGNVRPHTLTTLRSSIPYVSTVDNRSAGIGGVDGESIDAAKLRAPLWLRTRSRAVTARDYEVLAQEAAPGLARVHCVAEPDAPGVVRLLVVPSAADEPDGRLDFANLRPDTEILSQVTDYLEQRRTIGTRLIVEPPFYRGITVVARLTGVRHTAPARLREDALRALYGYLHPIRGGADGRGWPFGRVVSIGEVHALLQRVEGVEAVEDIRLYEADPIEGSRSNTAEQRIVLAPSDQVYSFEHAVLVQ